MILHSPLPVLTRRTSGPQDAAPPAAAVSSPGTGARFRPFENLPSRGLQDFALRTMPLVLGEGQENALFSPVSLWLLLSMLSVCTGGTCREQLLDVLGAESTEEACRLGRMLTGRLAFHRHALQFGSCICLSDSLPVSSLSTDTLTRLTRSFHADRYRLPMGTPYAAHVIARWQAAKTRMAPGPSSLPQAGQNTALMLLSAMHWKAPWVVPFSRSDTFPATFRCADGTGEKVPFMHVTVKSPMREEKTWTAASLSLRPGTLTFVLPAEGVPPEDLLNSPDVLRAAAGGRGFRPVLTAWSLPRFRSRSSTDLTGVMEKLGCGILLQPSADFRPLCSVPVSLGTIAQDAQMTVTEKGAEASAVTSCSAVATGLPPEPKYMVLNRPFLYLLSVNGLPLMSGIVRRP